MTSTPTTPPTQPTGPESTPQDEQHLKLLSIFYYVYGALSAVLSCFFMVYVIGGVILAAKSEDIAASDPEASQGLIATAGVGLAILWIFLILFVWLMAGLLIYTGRSIANRRHRIFCLVMAALTCLNFPLGTALGVYSFFALTRPGVTEMFRRRV